MVLFDLQIWLIHSNNKNRFHRACSCGTGHNFERGPSTAYYFPVWANLAQWFIRRKYECEKLTVNGRQMLDAK